VEKLDWYGNIPEIRGRTADENPVTVIVKVNVGYEQENKIVQSELIARTPRLQALIRQFFASKTSAELTPQHEEELKAELEEQINRIMTDGKIKEVIFLDFNVVEF
jgi:flagellar basal body-associated protein FliL